MQAITSAVRRSDLSELLDLHRGFPELLYRYASDLVDLAALHGDLGVLLFFQARVIPVEDDWLWHEAASTAVEAGHLHIVAFLTDVLPADVWTEWMEAGAPSLVDVASVPVLWQLRDAGIRTGHAKRCDAGIRRVFLATWASRGAACRGTGQVLRGLHRSAVAEVYQLLA